MRANIDWTRDIKFLLSKPQKLKRALERWNDFEDYLPEQWELTPEQERGLIYSSAEIAALGGNDGPLKKILMEAGYDLSMFDITARVDGRGRRANDKMDAAERDARFVIAHYKDKSPKPRVEEVAAVVAALHDVEESTLLNRLIKKSPKR